jgi:tetratricopeptide (TPR) repeat protein
MRRTLALLACLTGIVAPGPAGAAIDVDALWDYGRPAESEARFRAALSQAAGDDALVLRTQIARTFSLRGRFDEAHRELDALAPLLAAAGPEPQVRSELERGRTLRSAGQPAAARPSFERAFERAERAGLEALAADALHMIALVEPALEQRVALNRRLIEYAQQAREPKARRWEGPALNNIGSDLRDAGRLADSLAAFEQAWAVYERGGEPGNVRVARWQVANVLRLLGRADEALSMQLALERDAAAAGAPDVYVFEELALLYAARGEAAQAARYDALRAAQAAKDATR